MRKNHQILHITPHLGGGVGHVILNYLLKAKNDESFVHKIACLDYANKHGVYMARNLEILLLDNMSSKKRKLLKLISDSDIVLIHWWNHPLLYDFLVRELLPACRVIMWCHNNGFNPPFVFTEKALKYPDLFIFTTPASYETKEVKSLSDKEKNSLRAVLSTGGVEHVKSVRLKEHSGFNVGYIGTVDYAKMHPDFLKICDQVNIPDVKFIVCGGPNEKELKREAKELGIDAKFHITGPVSDITKFLSLFDIFGYPLAPYHYGTAEQVLQESMAAGVVPIVLDNDIERYLVKDGLTGIVAKDVKGYINAIEALYQNNDLKKELSKNAKNYAINNFSVEVMANEWKKIFYEVLNLSKTIKKWKINKKISLLTPKDIFLESLGDYGDAFVLYCNATNEKQKKIATEKIKKMGESANWQANTRSTVHHYNSFFPDDQYLSTWSKLMRREDTKKVIL